MRNLLFALLISMPVYPGVLFATLPQYRIFDPPIYLIDGELENVPEDLPWKDTLKAYANVDHFNSYEELLWFYSEELEEAWQVTEEAYYEMVKAGGRLGPASITFLYAVRLNTENENVVMLVLTRNNSKRPPAFSSPSFDAGIGAVSLIYREGRWQLIPTSREQFAYAHLYYSELKQEVTEGKARIVDQLYDERDFPNHPYPGSDELQDEASPSMEVPEELSSTSTERKVTEERATPDNGLQEPNDQIERKDGSFWLLIGGFLGFLCLSFLLVYLMRRK
jgi:hypothetical protein